MTAESARAYVARIRRELRVRRRRQLRAYGLRASGLAWVEVGRRLGRADDASRPVSAICARQAAIAGAAFLVRFVAARPSRSPMAVWDGLPRSARAVVVTAERERTSRRISGAVER